MKTSERVKAAGLDDLNEMAALSHRNRSTLAKWYVQQRDFFELVLSACVARKRQSAAVDRVAVMLCKMKADTPLDQWGDDIQQRYRTMAEEVVAVAYRP